MGKVPSVSESEREMDPRKLTFRTLLFRISERISRQDLENLTFISRDVIPVSRMERIRTAVELFQALTERGKLSENDLSYLAQILTTIGRGSLLYDLEAAGYSIPSPLHQNIDYMFQECLIQIAQNLKSSEVERLGFIMDSVLHISSDKIYSATQLFQMIEQRRHITSTNLRPLYDSLLEIGRKDLSALINTYLKSANLPTLETLENPINNDSSSLAHYGLPSLNMDPSTPSSGIASYRNESNSSMISGESAVVSDKSDYGLTSMEESSQNSSMGGTLVVSPTIEVRVPPLPPGSNAVKRILPFGLNFDVFEEDRICNESSGSLLQSLAVKEGEMRWKEEEIKRLKQELNSQIKLGERILEERAGECDIYSKSIQDLQGLVAVKTQEVDGLILELQACHHQMVSQQASSSIREEDLYLMNRQPHGICLIINNYEFHHPDDIDKAHPRRGGAEIDRFNLVQTFKYLRYDVIVRENLTAVQMQDAIFEMASQDHTMYDSFICCILTHGETNIVHGADSQKVNLLEFAATMKLSPTLREKPKMFFIQACRGEMENKGLDIQKDSGGSQVPPTITATIPQEADFFFGYATPSGRAAYRSKRHGSWYISELCKVFTQHAYTHNLSSMMKKVNFQVSKAYTKEGYKQCPEYVDRLRKEVHFYHFLRDNFNR